ncbi:hypothetical protein [Roseixanthobacter pseudopolyaromaticivorans]|uniref:hypothetical protein n=1 Tax=Xanthobacteraceae TaxID=335928 RepID=UPI0037297F54
MTAINLAIHPETIFVVTDGASYMADGTLGALSSKTYPLPHLNAVLAARGPHYFLPLVGATLSMADSFDDLVAGLADAVRDVMAVHGGLLSLCDIGPDFDLVVAGFGEAGPAAYVLTSKERDGVPAWEVQPMGQFVAMPWDAATEARVEHGLTLAEREGELDDPEGFLLRVVEAQRHVEEDGRRGVGGFAQVTVLDREGVSSRIVRRWGDVVGERLGMAALAA